MGNGLPQKYGFTGGLRWLSWLRAWLILRPGDPIQTPLLAMAISSDGKIPDSKILAKRLILWDSA